MSDRTKELILKILMVIDLILMFLLFPGIIFISFFVPDWEILETIFATIVIAVFSVGGVFMILWPIFGGIKPKPVQAEKIQLTYSSYNEFFAFLNKSLLDKKYKLQKSVCISPNAEVTLYLKPQEMWTLKCFVIIRVSELSEELLENANESITNILKEYYGYKTITDNINMISVFCVDRINSAFRKMVNTNAQQGFKNGRLPVGISFGGKNIYISRQSDGFAIGKHKRLRREFIDIMELQDAKR